MHVCFLYVPSSFSTEILEDMCPRWRSYKVEATQATSCPRDNLYFVMLFRVWGLFITETYTYPTPTNIHDRSISIKDDFNVRN